MKWRCGLFIAFLKVQEALLEVDLAAVGLPADSPFWVVDELSGARYQWQGSSPYVRLDPSYQVAHVLDLRPGGTATW